MDKIENKVPKILKNKKEIVKNGILLIIKHYRKFHNFWTSLDRWNRKENAKNAKKRKTK